MRPSPGLLFPALSFTLRASMLPALSAQHSPLPTDSIFKRPELLGEGGLISQASVGRLCTFLRRSLLPASSFFTLCSDHSADKKLSLSTAPVCPSGHLGLQAPSPCRAGNRCHLPWCPFVSLSPATEMERTGKEIKANPLLKS